MLERCISQTSVFTFAVMDRIAAAPSLYQCGPRKVLHLVRHAEGMHNLESDKSRDPLTSFELLDAQLTSVGWQQVADQRKHVCENGLLDNIQVVIVSPMTRTLQTAVGIFGGEDQPDVLDVTSSEDSNVKSDKTSMTSNSRPPIVAYELCRERLGKYECDQRRSISQYRSRFPAVDFSLIENEDDVLWMPNERESHDAVSDRTVKFIKWLWGRKEQVIAVVSHGVFLQEAMIQLMKNTKCCHIMNVNDDPKSRFKNCEIRSSIIFRESIMGLGSDSMMCNQQYCGRIGNEVLQIRDSVKDKVQVEELVGVTI